MKTLTWYLDDALEKMRDDAGMTQLELAAAIDVSRGSINNYETARTKPKWTTVQRWALACGIDPADNQLRALWVDWVPVIQRYREQSDGNVVPMAWAAEPTFEDAQAA